MHSRARSLCLTTGSRGIALPSGSCGAPVDWLQQSKRCARTTARTFPVVQCHRLCPRAVDKCVAHKHAASFVTYKCPLSMRPAATAPLKTTTPTGVKPTPASASAPTPVAATVASDVLRSSYESVTEALQSHGVWLPANSTDIAVIHTPSSFYEQLLRLIATAQHHIILSGLYLGTGPMEQTLVRALERRCQEVPGLKVTVVVDYNRGTHNRDGKGTSVSVLANLLYAHAQARVCLVQPKARPVTWWESVARPLMGGRLREACSVYHAKFFVFDDNVLISGANMSEIYFTQRQDRNVLLCNQPALSQFLYRLVEGLSSSSMCTTVRQDSSCGLSHTEGSLGDEQTMRVLRDLMQHGVEEQVRQPAAAVAAVAAAAEVMNDPKDTEHQGQHDTMVMPTLQLAGLGIEQDMTVFAHLMQWVSSFASGADSTGVVSRIHLATGYLSMEPSVLRMVQRTAQSLRCQTDVASRHGRQHAAGMEEMQGEGPRTGVQPVVHVMAASSQANGWYGASGYARHVPQLYAARLHDFLRELRQNHLHRAIQASLYHRRGWTFHAKGLWITHDVTPTVQDGAENENGHLRARDGSAGEDADVPASTATTVDAVDATVDVGSFGDQSKSVTSVTMLGSSNFGFRSVHRDLELQCVIATRDMRLANTFTGELRSIQHHCADVLVDPGDAAEVTATVTRTPHEHEQLLHPPSEEGRGEATGLQTLEVAGGSAVMRHVVRIASSLLRSFM